MSDAIPAVEPKFYSIVIIGAMNPRLHYPLWYKLIGLLTEEESDASRESKDFSITQLAAQFSFDDCRIVCLMDRWEINTTKEENRGRILQIACGVFEKLNETPLTAFGFNTWADLNTDCPKIGPVLAKIAEDTGLGFSGDGEKNCQFAYTKSQGFQTVQIVVRPSAILESMIWVAYNSTFAIEPQKGYFDLTPRLQEHFDPHWKNAVAFAAGVVKRVSEFSGVVRGN